MTLEEFASRIEKARAAKKKNGPGYIGRCPSCAHLGADKDCGHLLVVQGADDWLHVKCIVGCDEQRIMSAMGLSTEDRRITPYEPSVEKTSSGDRPVYVYEGPNGYVAEKHRISKPDGDKSFIWKVRFKNGVPVAKVEKKKRDGSTFMDYPTPAEAGLNGEVDILYRLPGVLKAIARGDTVYIGEGERASDAAAKMGICHTCQRAGAGPSKWLPIFAEQLKGAKEIVIIADRDSDVTNPNKGPAYSKEVFTMLRAAGFSVRVARSKTTGEGDDFRDHIEAGFKPEDLVPAPDLMPPRGLKVRETSANARLVETEHIISPYFPRRSTVILDGKGGTKKSFFMVCIAAALSNGFDPINKVKLPAPIKTLYIHKGGTEDDPSGGDNTDEKLNTIYRANGGYGEFFTADLERLDDVNCQLLIESIKDGAFGLIVIDYLFQFFDGMRIDINSPADAITICRRLLRVAVATDSCIVPLRHHSKGGGTKDARDPSELGSGTNQWHDGMRGHLVFRKHSDPPQREKGVIVVTDEKGDLLNEQGDAIIFSRRGNEMYMEEDIENPFGGDAQTDAGKMGFAENWLRNNLTGKLVDSKIIADTLESFGVSPSTMRRARKKLRVEAVQKPGGGWWSTIIDPNAKPDPFAD